MIRTFDYFNQVEVESLTLCNPDKSELYSVGLAYDTKLNLRYNAIGDFSFTFPKSIDGGETEIVAYQHIKNKKLVLVENFGYYIIDDVSEEMDGSQPIKKVSCKSLEYELVSKRVSAYGGTVKLYDILSPAGTLLDDMVALAPNWSVGDVDISLLTKYRTFSIADSTIYGVLSGEVSTAFECIFVFDSFNRTISAVAYDNVTSNTDVFLSFDNLIENASLSEKTDEITTCLAVYGGGTLNIRGVNPLGTDRIYDFSYYTNTDWMSSGLVTAITNWNALILVEQPIYADYLTTLKTYNSEMIDLRSTLTQYNSDYLSLEGVKKLRVQGGEDLTSINIELADKQLQIDSQTILIQNKQLQIDVVTTNLQAINTLVSFDNPLNFTPLQLLELNNFIYENTYQNENIIQTDLMNNVEIQDAQQDLYDQSKIVLGRISQPRYEIEFKAINYIELPEFTVFTQQTELGATFNVELNGSNVETVLLEMSLSFDSPTDFSMTFSNRFRLDNGNFAYSDLYGNVVKTGSKVSFDNLKWGNWENDYKDDVTTFITSSLNTANNSIINNNNQEILINQNGLRGRTLNPSTGTYDPTQVWLTSSVLAFTDDGFQTSKLALGRIPTSAGDKFGLVAGVIYGNLLAGNTLTISNGANNFVLDESGATLNNAKFSVSTLNTKINIDPTATNSFSIQKNEGGTFTDKFWVDNAGNVNFSGNLSGATGTFTGSITANSGSLGGWTISSVGISDTFGNYIRSNGNIKLGGLTISGSTATFTGNIYADKLVGAVSYSQLTDIPATKITSGTMSGSRVYGGTVGFPSGGLQESGGLVRLFSSGNQVGVNSVAVLLQAPDVYASGRFHIGGGNLYIDDNLALTTSKIIFTSAGYKTFNFIKGILVSVV